MNRTPPENIRGLVAAAMHAADDIVVVIEYRDAVGLVTERTVSPIRFDGPGRFVAYCLGREGVRTFYLGRCLSVRVQAAHDVISPVDVRALRRRASS